MQAQESRATAIPHLLGRGLPRIHIDLFGPTYTAEPAPDCKSPAWQLFSPLTLLHMTSRLLLLVAFASTVIHSREAAQA